MVFVSHGGLEDTMSRREPYASLEAMIAPAELSRLLGRQVDTASVAEAEVTFTSTGARFRSVRLDDEAEPSLFIKLVDPATDWVALFTEDRARRAVALWVEGVFARMPAEVDPAVIACASWRDGYAILMPNVGSYLMTESTRMPVRHSDAVLDAMAAMHAAFWEDDRLTDPTLGLCPVELFLAHTSPRKEAEVFPDAEAPFFTTAWDDAVPAVIDPGLARELRALNDDPTPIVRALESFPRTLVHSDIRPANLALRDTAVDGVTTVLIDWGRPVFTSPAIDLGYYLGWTALERPVSVDDMIGTYEARLAERVGERMRSAWWEPHREIGILGGLLQTLAPRATMAHREGNDAATERGTFGAWEERIKAALRLLDGRPVS